MITHLHSGTIKSTTDRTTASRVQAIRYHLFTIHLDKDIVFAAHVYSQCFHSALLLARSRLLVLLFIAISAFTVDHWALHRNSTLCRHESENRAKERILHGAIHQSSSVIRSYFQCVRVPHRENSHPDIFKHPLYPLSSNSFTSHIRSSQTTK